jgi:ABC-type transport system involved in multi-copper enzyme maturation permease subunit
MRQLIWKEWHEQRWKLGFGCIVLCAFALIGLHARIVADQLIIVGTCAMGVLILPILAAAGLFPAERGQGTLQGLLALPIARLKLLAAKTIPGLMLCTVPLFAAAAVSVLMTQRREISNAAALEMYGRAALTATSLFAWMLALTARSPNEGRGAALAVGVLVCWLILTSGLEASNRNDVFEGHVPTWLWSACPFVFVFPPPDSSTSIAVCVQTAIAAALWLAVARLIAVSHREDQ